MNKLGWRLEYTRTGGFSVLFVRTFLFAVNSWQVVLASSPRRTEPVESFVLRKSTQHELSELVTCFTQVTNRCDNWWTYISQYKQWYMVAYIMYIYIYLSLLYEPLSPRIAASVLFADDLCACV